MNFLIKFVPTQPAQPPNSTESFYYISVVLFKMCDYGGKTTKSWICFLLIAIAVH